MYVAGIRYRKCMLLALGMEKIMFAGIRYDRDMLLALGIGKICCWY